MPPSSPDGAAGDGAPRRRPVASAPGPVRSGGPGPGGDPGRRRSGMVFRIQPHVRLQEWVAEERGFFAAEGLDYEFEAEGFAAGAAAVTPAGEAPAPVRSGAFEDMAAGRSSDVSCACHWAVNAAAGAAH